jgi:hypothetical protein
MHDSKTRNVWNIIVLNMLLYTAWFVPYRAAFVITSTSEFDAFGLLDDFVDFLYILDLFLNFFMAYEDRDLRIETRLSWIAKNYLKTLFITDLFACIPFEAFQPE